MRNWIRSWLGIDELETRIEKIEEDCDNIENRISNIKDYHLHSDEKIAEMHEEVQELIEKTDLLIEHAKDEDTIQRARNFKRRLAARDRKLSQLRAA